MISSLVKTWGKNVMNTPATIAVIIVEIMYLSISFLPAAKYSMASEDDYQLGIIVCDLFGILSGSFPLSV